MRINFEIPGESIGYAIGLIGITILHIQLEWSMWTFIGVILIWAGVYSWIISLKNTHYSITLPKNDKPKPTLTI